MTRLMLTVPEVAEALGISASHVYVLAAAGRIPSRRYGKRVLVPRSFVEAEAGEGAAVPWGSAVAAPSPTNKKSRDVPVPAPHNSGHSSAGEA